ncbi:hypothetical protein BCR39DRAFT_577876 [Naematelia encephala]|uniref:Uncharacterized protein n=1 Tax=Naematelia encephala TaxID=71784 RepID=A0A1Y2BHN9_9TREE|nr:hypothetical protein BCR39DRAFT_577876 [Naematelia encephala]
MGQSTSSRRSDRTQNDPSAAIESSTAVSIPSSRDLMRALGVDRHTQSVDRSPLHISSVSVTRDNAQSVVYTMTFRIRPIQYGLRTFQPDSDYDLEVTTALWLLASAASHRSVFTKREFESTLRSFSQSLSLEPDAVEWTSMNQTPNKYTIKVVVGGSSPGSSTRATIPELNSNVTAANSVEEESELGDNYPWYAGRGTIRGLLDTETIRMYSADPVVDIGPPRFRSASQTGDETRGTKGGKVPGHTKSPHVTGNELSVGLGQVTDEDYCILVKARVWDIHICIYCRIVNAIVLATPASVP